MLKQANNDPIPFYKQAVLIYAGINWYIDELAIDKVLPFEKLLYQKMDTTHKALSDLILKEQALTEDIETKMKTLIQEAYEEISL